MVDFSKSRSDSDSKVIYRFNNWDRGLRSRTKNFRNNAFNLGRKLDFIDMDYMGGNSAKGFHKHTQSIQYKYRMRRHIEKKDENEFDDENLALEEQATQGGDVMGYRQLDKSKAKELMNFRKKPKNDGDNYSKGYFGAGMLKTQRQEEIDTKNNNKDTYKSQKPNEFSSLAQGIKKEKLEYADKNFSQATDGI
tara:strand:+ start:2394 stop:2972 length:579 start_codon:yes stop_codon:yes gene_type:complete